MVRKKQVKTKGKLQLSKYFQEFLEGDTVSVVKEMAVSSSFPKRIQGRTGTIESKRGRAYIVNIKDSNMNKKFLIEPIHLKKIKMIQSPMSK